MQRGRGDIIRLSAEHWKEVKAARLLQESRSARGGVEVQEYLSLQ
jgi:hypothetical protein